MWATCAASWAMILAIRATCSPSVGSATGWGRVQPASGPTPGWPRLGLAPRLLLNNLLVIVAGAGTVVVTVLLIAPVVFQLHLRRAGVPLEAGVLEHIGRALDVAVLVSVGVGVIIATLTASSISWLVARRLAAAVREAADTSRHLADGHLDARVPDPGMGPELATLAASLNELAQRLQATEATRRELTADLAHQLRTPIASIEATLEAVREQVLPDDLTLETLTAQSARLRRLVADLEVVSRAEERQLLLDVERVAVPALVEEALAAQRERSGRRRPPQGVPLTAAIPPVLVDPTGSRRRWAACSTTPCATLRPEAP